MYKFKLLLVLAGVFFATLVIGQLPSLPSNLGAYRSSDISEEQLTQVISYIQQNNITTAQVYSQLIRRGMKPSEADLLRTRIERALGSSTNKSSNDTSVLGFDEKLRQPGYESRMTDTVNRVKVVANPKKIFGLEIFNNGVLSFEPNLKIATPVGYIIGPDDEIVINIYGYQEAKYNLKVSPEGDINIPYAGEMYVAGLTIEQAAAKIKSKLSISGYSNIKSGLTKVSISVSRIRSIKVTVLGEVRKPGTYTLPSLATAFNALYLSGGPNDIGSMRNIQIVRNGKVIDVLDIYDFLVKGDQRNNINLRDQDIIRIPAYSVRVSIEGEVKRTGLYEIKKGETLQNLFDFAGGFSDSAYTASITGYKIADTESKIIDIAKSEYSKYFPTRSESFLVKKIVGRYTNRVTINGAVYLPGDYELSTGMSIKQLVEKARGLREDAYSTRGLITRRKADLTPEYISFMPADVMQNNSSGIVLKANDVITISVVGELKDKATVTIFGEVRDPGSFEYFDNLSLKDLILLAGGFSDAAIPQKIEVARRIRNNNFDSMNMEVSKVFDITTVNDLDVYGGDLKLEPYDAIVVRRNPSFQAQVSIRVEGEVAFPGPYVLKTKNERISDVLKRAGGLTRQAFIEGGYLTRVNRSAVTNEINSKKIIKIQETLKDTSNNTEEEIFSNLDQIAIDLKEILQMPGSINDLILEEGDIITITKEKMDVRISGQVLFPTRVVYDKNMTMEDYLGRAGGITDNAQKRKIYVLYPNGNAAKTSTFLFFKKFPKITPGSEVIIPKKHLVERRRLSTGEVIGIATAITSFAGVLLSLLININK